MTQVKDQVLVRQCLRGDSDAFGVLVRRYEGRVYAIAYGALVNHADAEEATQRAFMRAFGRLERLRAVDRFRPWLYRITQSCARDEIRRRTRETPVDSDREFAERPDPVVPQEEFERREDALVIVEGALRTLPDTYRIPIAMRYMGEASYDEIAESMAISIEAAQKRVSKGLARPRSYFARAGLEETAMDVLRTRCLVLPVGLGMGPTVMEHVAALRPSRRPHGSTGLGRWSIGVAGGVTATVGTLWFFLGSWGVNANLAVPGAGVGLLTRDPTARVSLYRPAEISPQPQLRSLVLPGQELVGWQAWKAHLDPTVPVASAQHYLSGPAGAVVETNVGVWREFEPTYGEITAQVWIRPAPGNADLYLFLMIDGERGYEHGVGIYKHGTSGWWHYGNLDSTGAGPQGVALPGFNQDRWIPFAPVSEDGDVIRIVHSTSAGSYDIYVDGQPKALDIVVPWTRGKPFTGLWMNSGLANAPHPSYFDDLRVTVVERVRDLPWHARSEPAGAWVASQDSTE